MHILKVRMLWRQSGLYLMKMPPGACAPGGTMKTRQNQQGNAAWAPLQFLVFFNGDSADFANFHTGFTAQAFFGVYGFGLAVLDFVNFNGAHVHAFATAHALVNVNINIITHGVLQICIDLLDFSSG